MRRGLRRNNKSAERSATHMLLRAGEDKQKSGPAPSSQPELDDFLFPVVYFYLYYESTLPIKPGVLLEAVIAHEAYDVLLNVQCRI
jgi:hypothetical protein